MASQTVYMAGGKSDMHLRRDSFLDYLCKHGVSHELYLFQDPLFVASRSQLLHQFPEISSANLALIILRLAFRTRLRHRLGSHECVEITSIANSAYFLRKCYFSFISWTLKK